MEQGKEDNRLLRNDLAGLVIQRSEDVDILEDLLLVDCHDVYVALVDEQEIGGCVMRKVMQKGGKMSDQGETESLKTKARYLLHELRHRLKIHTSHGWTRPYRGRLCLPRVYGCE